MHREQGGYFLVGMSSAVAAQREVAWHWDWAGLFVARAQSVHSEGVHSVHSDFGYINQFFNFLMEGGGPL